MAQNVVTFQPDETVIWEDFADFYLLTLDPSQLESSKYRYYGRLYLTNQRLIHVYWPKRGIIVSRKLELSLLFRFVKPKLVLDASLTNIAALRVHKAVFGGPNFVDVEFVPNTIKFERTSRFAPTKKLHTQYQMDVEWNTWSSHFEKAFAAQGLRLREVEPPPVQEKPPEEFAEEFAEIFKGFANKLLGKDSTTRWVVEKI